MTVGASSPKCISPVRIRLSGSTIVAIVLALAIFLFAWSIAFYLLLGFNINGVRPWSVVEFLLAYGIFGAHANALALSFAIALGLTLSVGLGLYLTRPKHYYGDARWATKTQLYNANLLDKGGILLGRFGRKYLRNDEPGHTFMAAPTRSGKGVGVVIPNLLSWPGSVVVLDIKHENHAITSGFREVHGSAVFKWSPADEDARSHRFNPLDSIRSDINHRVSDVQRLAQILLPTHRGEDSMWQDEARDLFLGIVLYVLDTTDVPSTLGEVYRTLKTDADLADVIGHILDTREDLDPNCAMSLSNFAHKALKERSGVKSNLTAALNLWANPVIDAATSASDFDLSELRKKPMSIYVAVTLNQLASLSRLLNLFFQQTIDVLSRAMPDETERYPVLLLIDEFASLGRMDIATKAMAFLAGFNVRMLNIVQGLGQLDEHYGIAGRENILQNHSVQIYYSANDSSTAEYISKRLGTKTIRTHSQTDPGGFRWGSKSRSYAPRELMKPEEVRQLSNRKEILFKESQRPVLAHKIVYYKDKIFRRRLLSPADVPLLNVKPAAPRHFELPEDNGSLPPASDRTAPDPPSERAGAMETTDDLRDSEHLGLAGQLQSLFAAEAEESSDVAVSTAAKRLKDTLGPDPTD